MQKKKFMPIKKKRPDVFLYLMKFHLEKNKKKAKC